MALTFDDKRKALGKKLIEEINKPAPTPERHLLRDKTREIVTKHSQSKKVSPQRIEEIVEEAFSPENSIFKRKLRERG